MTAVELANLSWRGTGEGPWSLEADVAVRADIVVDLDARLAFSATPEGASLVPEALLSQALDVCWLPRGEYRISWTAARLPAAGFARLAVWGRDRGERARLATAHVALPAITAAPGSIAGAWQLASAAGTKPIEELAWKQGYASWFFQHFDHASRTLVEFISADSPAFRGSVLDVGCGDGITALGVALRYAPREIVGIDPYRTYENLPAILARHGLGHLRLPPNLRFLAEDANALPFADDSFDAILSWAAVEHFAGGYRQALGEMRRVLKPGGVLFIHPGLYYANRGHHLAEYSDEPFFHLVKEEEEIRRIVFETPARYADRGGATPTREQHWQWYRELNHISVTEFEEALRALDFAPWRVALRTDAIAEYRPGMERYRFTDIGVAELYVACHNRKPAKD